MPDSLLRHSLTILAMLLPVVCCQAAEPDTDDWQQLFIEMMEDRDDGDDMSDDELQDMLDELREMAAHPFNLNHATHEQLLQLPFLSEAQADDIEAYLFRHAPMRSMGELHLIQALDWQAIRLLPHFAFIDPEEAANDSLRLLRIYAQRHDNGGTGKGGTGGSNKGGRNRGDTAGTSRGGTTFEQWQRQSQADVRSRWRQQHELTAGGSVPFYRREGDAGSYLGFPYRHWLRYDFRYGQRLRAGVVAAQETGEPFFAGDNRWGYDHYSAYLSWQGRGAVERVVAGAYRVQLGLGLTINNGMSPGKQWARLALTRRVQSLRPYTSRSQSNHLFGAGTTLRLARPLHATVFAAYQPVDATLNADGSIRTLLTTNPHRTPAAMQKRHAAHMATAGLSLRWAQRRWHIAVNAVLTQLDRSLQPGTGGTTGGNAYRRDLPQGKHFTNMSVSYEWRWTSGSLRGETAADGAMNMALLHILELRPWNPLTLTAIHRYYQPRHASLRGNSFGENSRLQNEHGLYLGTTWRPDSRLTLTAYADYAHFAAPRYRCPATSDAADGAVELQLTAGDWQLLTRYRLHLQQRSNTDGTMLRNELTGRLRMSARRYVGQRLELRLQMDGTHHRFDGHTHLGAGATAAATYKTALWQLTAQTSYFHTDDYDSRLYVYEPALPYLGGFPAYYDHGLRALLQAQTKMGRHITLMARYALTHYFNRNTIGTGLQAIHSDTASDLDLQLCWQW